MLYLNKNDGEVIADAASECGIKHIRIDGGAPYSKTPLARWLEDCASWCSGGWKRGAPRLSNLIRTWIGFHLTSQTDEAKQRSKAALLRFLFSRKDQDLSLGIWLSEFGRACLRELFEKEEALRDELAAFRKLLLACGANGKLRDFRVSTFAGQIGSPEHLNLLTLHSAKGLEFDVAIMMGMDQGKIPSWNATSSQDKQEARRIFYVGLTRARHEVHLVYSGWNENRYGRRFENGPSEFVLEVEERLSDYAR